MKRSASLSLPAPRARGALPRPPLALALAGAMIVPLLLSACGLHSGASEIAFLQGSQVWTVQSDGSSAGTFSQSGALDFAWSPDHHQLVFRYTSSSPTAFPGTVSTQTVSDAPADLAIESVNGGYALQITPAQRGELRSAAWWDASGNRLAYREASTPGNPVLFVVSQADQPVGIARKIMLDDVSIPALSPDGKRVAVLDPSGSVRVGAPGQLGSVVASGALTGIPVPGGLRPARVLWQPGHNALLFPSATATGVAFVLHDLASGDTRTLATTSSPLDAAFSPDGTLLLVRTPQSFELWSATGASTAMPVFSWPESDPLALPWWSPDGRAILIQDASGWTFADVAAKRARQVVTFPPASSASPAAPSSNPTWTPATGDPWSPDGSQMVFAAPAGTRLDGTPLAAPSHGDAGLYVASPHDGGLSSPTLIYSGTPRAPAWGYAAPDTVFLAAAYSG